MAEKKPEVKQTKQIKQTEKKPRFSVAQMVAAGVAFLAVLFTGIAIFNQSQTMRKVSRQIEGLEQRATESQDATNKLSERVQELEARVAEQEQKTGPEALEAQFIEYYEKIDKKTNTLIGVVVALAILVFTVVVTAGVILVVRSYKDIERKLDGAGKTAGVAMDKSKK
jgi:predicted PurR-regulated permease PerM